MADQFQAQWDATIARLDADKTLQVTLQEELRRVRDMALWHFAMQLGLELAERNLGGDGTALYEAVSCYPSQKLAEWFPGIDLTYERLYERETLERLIEALRPLPKELEAAAIAAAEARRS